MTTPAEKVLIVGAGALGTVLGYHLAMGGAQISFYVRPKRLERMARPQRLYCYEDATIRDYSGYDVVSTAAEVAETSFDFVIVTLDGAQVRSDEGRVLLRDLADAIRPTRAAMILCGVGLDLRQDAVKITGLADDRVLLGTLAYMCHETDVGVPVPAGVDPAVIGSADYAYGHTADRTGFTIARSSKDVTTRFAAMVNRAGVEHCVVVSPGFYSVFTSIFFAFTVASELAGWPDSKGFAARPEKLSLAVAAMKEIAGLRRYGGHGRRFAAALSEQLVMGMMAGNEEGLRPLDFTEFNRYHHGGKMLSQNVGMLRDCLKIAEDEGRPATALRELLSQYDEHARVHGVKAKVKG